MALLFVAGGAAAAVPPPVDVRFGRHPGFWRIALEWAEPTAAEVTTTAETVRLAPFAGPPATAALVARRLDAVVRHAVVADATLTLFLRAGVDARALAGLDPRILAVDFAPPRARPVGPATAAAIVPRRRPPPTSPAATGPATTDTATVRPFPVAPPPAAASAEVAAPGNLPPLPPAPRSPPADATAAAVGDARVALPPPPTELAEPAPPRALTPPPARPRGDVPLTGPLAAPTARETAERAEPVASTPAPVSGTARADGPAAAGGGDADGAAASSRADRVAPAVRIGTAGDGVVFAFPTPVEAAAWRRGETIWLVFRAAPDAWPVDEAAVAGVEMERVAHDRAMVWRVEVAADAPRRLTADGSAWRLEPGRPVEGPATAAAADAERVAVRDPWLGESWHVVPLEAGAGAARAIRREGPTVWLPTLQGRRFRDLREVARIDDRRRGEPAGAGPSPALERPGLGPLIGLAQPTLPAAVAAERRRALEAALFLDPTPGRRLALARFLMGRAQPFDALAVLGAAPTPASDAVAARLDALVAVAATLAGRLERAAALMPPPPAANAEDDADSEAERWLWRGMLAAAREEWAKAGEAFARSGQAWRDYPLPLRRRVAERATATALALDAPGVAQSVLHQVRTDDVAQPMAGELALLEARALEALGERAAARDQLVRLEEAVGAPDLARRARLARVRLDHEDGALDDAAARALLEADVVGWTGRDDGRPFWSFLADRRAATGDAPGAFAAWRRAGVEEFGEPQRAVIDALVAGEPPFEGALADAVVVVEAYVDGLAAGTARVELLRRLAARVAAETDALHVADRLYERALAEPVPHAVGVELRLALARLRLERRLPGAALAALAPLDGAADDRVAALAVTARAARAGREPPGAPPSAPSDAAEAAAPPAGAEEGLDARLRAVERTLAETRRLLEEEARGAAASGDDG